MTNLWRLGAPDIAEAAEHIFSHESRHGMDDKERMSPEENVQPQPSYKARKPLYSHTIVRIEEYQPH